MQKKLTRTIAILLLIITIFSIPTFAFSRESFTKVEQEDTVCVIEVIDLTDGEEMRQLEHDLLELTKEIRFLER